MKRLSLRSMKGCAQCRARRKKCEEQRPICSACRRLSIYCSYMDQVRSSERRLEQLNQLSHEVSTEGSTIVARIGVNTIYIKPIAGYTAETHTVIQYYVKNWFRYCNVPVETPTASFLALLPLGYSDPMVLASLTALLAIFMPEQWTPRVQTMIALSGQAMANVGSALSKVQSIESLDKILLSAGLLHLTQVHYHFVSTVNWSHLRGSTAIVKAKLHLHAREARPPPHHGSWIAKIFGAYVYHLTINSTINYDLLVNDTPSHVDRCIAFCREGYRSPPLVTRLLFVPTTYLAALSRLACLRGIIVLGGAPRQALVDQVVTIQIDNCYTPLASNPALYHTETLFRNAIRVFRWVLLQHCAVVGLDISTSDERWSEQYREEDWIREATELDAAIHYMASAQHPFHVATWPLFILGLACRESVSEVIQVLRHAPGTVVPPACGDDVLSTSTTFVPGMVVRDSIRQCLTNLVNNSHVASVQHVLDFLETVWRDEDGIDRHSFSGLSILLSAQLHVQLVF